MNALTALLVSACEAMAEGTTAVTVRARECSGGLMSTNVHRRDRAGCSPDRALAFAAPRSAADAARRQQQQDVTWRIPVADAAAEERAVAGAVATALETRVAVPVRCKGRNASQGRGGRTGGRYESRRGCAEGPRCAPGCAGAAVARARRRAPVPEGGRPDAGLVGSAPPTAGRSRSKRRARPWCELRSNGREPRGRRPEIRRSQNIRSQCDVVPRRHPSRRQRQRPPAR